MAAAAALARGGLRGRLCAVDDGLALADAAPHATTRAAPATGTLRHGDRLPRNWLKLL